jgi:hypothetical protein
MANATHIANSIFLLVLGRQILSAIGSNTPLLDTGTFACLLAAGLFGLNRGLFSQVVLSQNIIPFWQSWLATSVIAVGISLAAAPRFGALALIAAPILSQLPYVYWRTILEAFRHMRVGPAATPPGAGRNTVRTATVPNFLVIGAARAGTTSIDAGLRQHPSLFMCPRKEPNYFAMAGRRVEFTGPGDMEHLAGKSVTSMDDYLALFRGAGRSQTAGEVSPMYLCDPLAPGRIHGFNPEMRLIAVLRDPVMRAFSGHMMMVRDGRETLSFEDALAAGPGRVAAGWEMLWDHDAISRYSAQVERYLALFPRSQIKFCLYRNYRLDPASFWREVFDFLDVDNTVKITNVELNESFLPRSRVLNRWIHEEMPLKSFARRLLPPRFGKSARAALIRLNRERPAMSKETRRKLIERHRDDILRLQDLLQMDLGLWLQI